MPHAIRVEGLTKRFFQRAEVVAVDHLNLEVQEGEIFGFLGPNGAGKTTTIKMLLGLIFPDEGSAEVLGHPAGALEMRRHVSYLPENPYFYDYLTAEELLDYFGGLFGYDAATRRQRTARLLDEVGIGAERRLQLRKFSKGMRQRVGIAQALINEPDVVFLDEPMYGLDPLGRREIRELILRLRDRGCTVFFSSHVLSDAEALCSRVAILVGGRLAAEGSLSALLANREKFAGRKVGTVLSGGNIDTHLLANVLVRDLVRQGRIARLRVAAQDQPGALAKITAKLCEAGVNVIEINHSRIFNSLPAKDTVIEVECEAKDPEAIDGAVKLLEDAGFRVEHALLD